MHKNVGTSVRRSSWTAFGRSTGNDVVATINVIIFFSFLFFFFFFLFSPSSTFLIEGVLGSKNLFSERCLKCRKAKYVQHRVCFVIVQVPCPHSNIYVKLCTSRLCIKMSSFLFVSGCAMPRILYLSCEVPFPVWTPDDISGLISVVPWLSREELSKKNCR